MGFSILFQVNSYYHREEVSTGMTAAEVCTFGTVKVHSSDGQEPVVQSIII